MHGIKAQKLLYDNVVVHEDNAVFLIWTIAIEIPTGGYGFLMERAEEGLLDVIRDGHIILDGIKTAKDHIE